MNMISTGAFLTEMDASNKQPTVAEKFAAVWEKKNAKAARAGGVSLMALSLAACGGSSSTTTTTTPAADPEPTTPVVPADPDPVAMKTTADKVFGTDLNDTFTATVAATGSTLTSGDVIADSSSTDSDALNITSTSATVDTGLATIVGIEKTTVTFDTFGTATVDAEGVKDGHLTVVQSQEGANGNATVNGKVGSIEISGGSGVSGTLTVDNITAGSSVVVNAGSAATVTTTTAGAKGSMTIKGGADTTTATAVADTIDVTVTKAASTVNLTGVTASKGAATVSIGESATIVNNATAMNTIDISSSFAATATKTATATLTTTAPVKSINLSGANDIVLAGNESLFDGKTITDGSTAKTTLHLTTVNTSDLSKASVDVIKIDNPAGATTLSVNDNATIEIAEDIAGGALTIDADDDVTDTATTYLKGTLNLNLNADDIDGNSITIDNSGASDDGFDTVNLTVSKAQDATGLNLIAGTAAVTATGAKDLKLQATSTMKSLDAGEMSGAVTVVFDNTNDIATVTTGSGKDTITNSTTAIAAATKAVINTGAGNDTLTMLTAANATIDGGTGYDKVNLVGDISKLKMSNVEELATTGNVTSALTSQISGTSLVMSGANTFTFGTAASNFDTDTIDLSSLQINNLGQITVNVGNGLSTAKFTTDTGVTILGSTAGDVLTGTGNADTINGNGGADDITGGAKADTLNGGEGADEILAAGGDTIVLTETTSAADNVIFAAITAGSAAGTAAGTFSGFNVVTGFATTVDDLVFDAGNAFNGDTVDTDIIGNAAGNVQVVKSTAATTDSKDLTMDTYTNVDKVVDFLNDGGYTDPNTGTADVSAVVVTFDDFSVVYAINNNTTDAIIASEVTLVTTVDEVLVSGDILIT